MTRRRNIVKNGHNLKKGGFWKISSYTFFKAINKFPDKQTSLLYSISNVGHDKISDKECEMKGSVLGLITYSVILVKDFLNPWSVIGIM